MSVIELLGRSAPPPRVSHAERERDRIERDEPDPVKRRNSEQFAQVLALLAGTGSRARIDLLRQMPKEGASALDRLLTQANVEGGEGMTESNVLATDAATALRYGILKRGDENALARAMQNVQQGGNDIIARISGRSGASVEELMAMGDTRTAELKKALDTLLSRGGSENDPLLSANIAAAAFVSALAEAHAASASDVASPVKDPDALAPEFRERLERVIARMKSEYGHEVSIVETARSQERQDHLFEQGRTRPGPVVTWTRDSAHIEGFAADVVVDDKWNNPQGYARLQQIAREEGLRTLGARDQGHLELPRDLRASAAIASNTRALRAEQQLTSTSAGEATYAQGVARVAGVAQVAGVARVGAGVPEAARSVAVDARVTSSSIAGDAGNGEAMLQQGGMSNEQRSNGESNDAHARRDDRGQCSRPVDRS